MQQTWRKGNRKTAQGVDKVVTEPCMMGSSRAGLRATILCNRRIDNFGQKYCLRRVRKFNAMHRRAAWKVSSVVQYPVQAVLDAPVAAHQVGHACGADDHGQVGDVVVHGPFGHYAHGAAQPDPAAVGIELVLDAIGTAHDRAGTPLGASVPPLHQSRCGRGPRRCRRRGSR